MTNGDNPPCFLPPPQLAEEFRLSLIASRQTEGVTLNEHHFEYESLMSIIMNGATLMSIIEYESLMSIIMGGVILMSIILI